MCGDTYELNLHICSTAQQHYLLIQVHVTQLYKFPVALAYQDMHDLLVWRQADAASGSSKQSTSSSSSSSSFDPVLGSMQHGALWEEFMRQAKKHKLALEAVQEEDEQQQQQQQQQKQSQDRGSQGEGVR